VESELERHLPDVEAGATLYVADEDLNVVFTNEEWRRFARGNKGESIAVPDSDAHLLENMSGKARARWTSIYGLLLDGELPSYEEDFVCSNFGHERPLFSRTGPVELEPGLPVGMVDAGKRWHTTRLDLEEHGRRFLVFSDGITEQFGPAGAMFGTGRLLDSFRRHLAREPDAMVRAIVDDVERFRADAIVKDDRTLLALELG